MDITVRPLAEYPEFLDLLAGWTYGEWGHFDSSNSLEKTRLRLATRMNHDRLPICFVAMKEGVPLGCVSVKFEDVMRERYPEAPHWIGSMFVHSDFRRQGAGHRLMTHVLDSCEALGVKVLYLWTGTAERFYSKYDFRPLDRLTYLGQDVVVMKRDVD